MSGEGQFGGGGEDLGACVLVAGSGHVDEDRLAVSECGGDGLPVLGRDGRGVDDAEQIAVASFVVGEHPDDIYVDGH